MKPLSVLIALLMFLPLTVTGEELTQLYLSRSAGEDYAAYLEALGEKAAAAETVVLYESATGDELAEGQNVTLTVSVPWDMFGYPRIAGVLPQWQGTDRAGVHGNAA